MTTKQIRIMFYDEKQGAWVVDTMEVTEDEREQESETSQDTNDSPATRVMAFL